MASKIKVAVAYCRMSSDQQTESIERQVEEIQRFADANGYQILRFYQDAGISGRKGSDKRPGLRQLLLDSGQPEWSHLIVWKNDRFSRQNPLSTAGDKDTLRKNKKIFISVTEGVQDWNSLSGQLMTTVQDSQAEQYSRNQSENSISGRQKLLLEKKQYPHGNVPYGYDRVYTDQQGRDYRVGRRELFRKPLNWTRRLEINSEESKVVERIFSMLLDSDSSLRAICTTLSMEKIPTPDGAENWCRDTLKALITNKTYAGFATSGRLRKSAMKSDEEVFGRMGHHEVAGAVPEIITLTRWELAQAKLSDRKEKGSRGIPRSDKSGMLSGLLVCGHCGYALAKHQRVERLGAPGRKGKRPPKDTPKPAKGTEGQTYIYYSCDSPMKRPAIGCKQWRVREKELLPLALTALVDAVDRAVLIRAHGDSQPSANSTDNNLDLLKKELAKIRGDIDRGNENLLLVTNPDRVRTLEKTLDSWAQRADELEKEIQLKTITEGRLVEMAREWESNRKDIVSILDPKVYESEAAKELGLEQTATMGYQINKDRVRALLKDLGLKIQIFWKPQMVLDKSTGQPRPSTRFFELDRGKLTAKLEHYSDDGNITNTRKVLEINVEFSRLTA